MARARVPTIDEIENIYASGDIEKMIKLNETLANRANTRLKALEKAGLDSTAAYNRAMNFIQEYKELGTGRNFSRRKTLSADELYLNTKEAAKFLRSQTSTPAGEMMRRERIYNTLTKKDESGKSIIPAPKPEEADSYKKKFLDFLDEDVWSEIKKSLYADTNVTMDQAGEAIAGGAKVEDLVSAFNEYLEGSKETDLFELWDNWRSPKKAANAQT